MAETWRLFTTWGAAPSFNMGLDEALLFAHGAPPTLRLYTWSPDTLSLGYFQALEDVPGAERAGALVRRITGGGAIHHRAELTFSIAAELEHPLYRGPVARSYERVHALIVRALARHGVAASERGALRLASDRSGTGMCFHASTAQDLVWDERKGVGSAQRRKDGRVLHHGSIKLGGTPLEGDIATLERAGVRLTPEELGRDLEDVFAQALDLRLVRGVPTAGERAAAAALGARYVDPAFVRARRPRSGTD
jgi:lipoate-protein ligase A